MKKRKITLSYIFFYILFLPDTYRIIIGIIAAWLLAPYVVEASQTIERGAFMIWIMIAAIGYSVSAPVGKIVSEWMKKIVLADRYKK